MLWLPCSRAKPISNPQSGSGTSEPHLQGSRLEPFRRSHAIGCSSTIVQPPVQSGSCLLANQCHLALITCTG
ncbi:unnamed protein product [Arctogadus glacialis]